MLYNPNNSIDETVEMFTQFINASLDIYAPFKRITTNLKGKSRIHLGERTQQVIRNRDALRQSLGKANSVEEKKVIMSEYKKERNLATRLIRSEKREKISSNLASDPSMKNVWKITNRILQPNGDQSPLILKE